MQRTVNSILRHTNIRYRLFVKHSILFVFLLGCLGAGISSVAFAQDDQRFFFLPIAQQEPIIVSTEENQESPESAGTSEATAEPTTAPTPTATITPTPASGYTPSAEELALGELFTSDPQQQRVEFHWNAKLAQTAHAHAQDMAVRRYFGHTDPNGYGPNYHVRQSGYTLPDYYGSSNDANNVESIAAGYTTAQAVWEAWLASSGHQMHVLGTHDFYRSQIDYGIGYVYDANSPFKSYWVLITAQSGE